VSLFSEARPAAPRPERRAAPRRRRAKLVAAFVLTALVGVGSFAATYRTMELISVPAPANGSIPSGSNGTTVSVPQPATPVQTPP
jgi:hypothetical protein